jgi:hypothetical protein|tara:strand:- start:552 stop:758 length:207 start_codon:yes stop_codon:yes gene_type:complete
VSKFNLIEHFCLIQMQVLSDREQRLRKDLQDCAIQREYLSHFLTQLHEEEKFEGINLLIKEVKVIEDK